MCDNMNKSTEFMCANARESNCKRADRQTDGRILRNGNQLRQSLPDAGISGQRECIKGTIQGQCMYDSHMNDRIMNSTAIPY